MVGTWGPDCAEEEDTGGEGLERFVEALRVERGAEDRDRLLPWENWITFFFF